VTNILITSISADILICLLFEAGPPHTPSRESAVFSHQASNHGHVGIGLQRPATAQRFQGLQNDSQGKCCRHLCSQLQHFHPWFIQEAIVLEIKHKSEIKI